MNKIDTGTGTDKDNPRATRLYDRTDHKWERTAGLVWLMSCKWEALVELTRLVHPHPHAHSSSFTSYLLCTQSHPIFLCLSFFITGTHATYCSPPQNSWIWQVRCSWRELTSPLWRSPRCWPYPAGGRYHQSVNQPITQSDPQSVLLLEGSYLVGVRLLQLRHRFVLLLLLALSFTPWWDVIKATYSKCPPLWCPFLTIQSILLQPTQGLARLQVFDHPLSQLLLPVGQELTSITVIQRTVYTENSKPSALMRYPEIFFLHICVAKGLPDVAYTGFHPSKRWKLISFHYFNQTRGT